MKINLFALTGFGNVALLTLLKYNSIEIVKLYTRKEKNSFPYYNEKQLDLLAQENSIEIKYIDDISDWNVDDRVEMNLVVTFHRIFKSKHLKQSPVNINIHPSLLPSYKGPTPTNWVLFYKEKKTGITAHYVTELVDEGDIIYQKEYPITTDEDNLLRKFLAEGILPCINHLITKYPKYKIIEKKYISSTFKSYFQKPGVYHE